MFVAIEKNGSIQELKQLVGDQRHSNGWDYLAGPAGDAAEAAFNAFANLVETANE